MTARTIERAWCGEFQYPGREPFMLGTAMLPPNAGMAEVEHELLRSLASVLPNGTPPPTTLGLYPGEIVFTPEEPMKGTAK